MNQADFLSGYGQSQFAELCNALYERELHDLSWNGPDNAGFLKRRLASLPSYVKRASHALLRLEQTRLQQHQNGGYQGLLLDVQNASWQGKQAAHAPARKHQGEKLQHWLQKNAALGLVMPVQVEHQQLQSVYLDSIDQLDLEASEAGRVHLNRYGWFYLDGRPLDEAGALLLKPTRQSMTAACCGHQWSVAGRKLPRTLSLREVLLATTLQWPRFTQVVPLPA
ncbi:hypothetical protein CWE12_02895 [Aliidiomarina sedimenti]|uniref:Uncharacterized protein n=1 Tax=Aliidiomarina sedimenti TaxID=1933879 RepID=A0ABY0C2W7_9GAMM|nr:hypothetical protein [Aliidiomarina sedimenti]RUO31958.1 hypothetical protein CWE12_02895 [Aliidiomarina sedimenti]